MALHATFLATGGPQTHLLHFLLNSRHGAQMLDIKLLSRVLELIYSAFHLFQVGVYLCSILVVDVHNFDQTFLKHQPLFL